MVLEGILHHNIFFLLLLFVLVATEAETVQCTHYKDFKTRRDLNLLMYSVCAALLICLMLEITRRL